MTLTRLTPVDGASILTLEACKDHLRVSSDRENALITSMRDAAIGHVERISGLALQSGSWSWAMPRLSGKIELPIGPVTAVTSLTYLDAEGVAQTYAGHRLIDGKVYPAASGTWPTAYDYAAVTFTAGLESVPEELLAAVKMQLQILWDRGRSDPSTMKAMRAAADELIQTYRPVLV